MGLQITNCQPLLDLVCELKLEPSAACFMQPVDWRGLNITNYTTIVKKPMDMGTLEVSEIRSNFQENLKNGKYELLEVFLQDLQLIWDNCILFNKAGS